MTDEKKKGTNPFYALVVVAGIAFTITVCAYGLLMVRSMNPAAPGADQESGMLAFLDQHGLKVLLIELAVLGVASFAAMATDDFWTRKN
ncbi:MAG: hypothetical protein U0939_07090 [Pirellulales bacterium]